MDDPEDPGAHRAAHAVVVRAGAPQVQERLLRDVLGDRPRADHPVGERVGRAGVAFVDRLERARLTPRHQRDQVLVGECANVHVRGCSRQAAVLDHRSGDNSSKTLQRLARGVPERAGREVARAAWTGRAACGACAAFAARTRPTAAPPPTTTAAAGPIAARGQLRGSLIASSSHDSSSSAASPTSAVQRRLEPLLEVDRRVDRRERRAQHVLEMGAHVVGSVRVGLHDVLELPDGSMDQHLRRAVGAVQRPRDLAVVHTQREAHDQRLAAVVRAVAGRRGGSAPGRRGPAPGPRWCAGVEIAPASSMLVCGRRDAVAVVVRRQVVRDADQPRPQRAPLGLLLGAREVPVGLQERLLGQVLRVVVIAHAVVRVRVDVLEVCLVELAEVRVELGLVRVRWPSGADTTPPLRSAPSWMASGRSATRASAPARPCPR